MKFSRTLIVDNFRDLKKHKKIFTHQKNKNKNIKFHFERLQNKLKYLRNNCFVSIILIKNFPYFFLKKKKKIHTKYKLGFFFFFFFFEETNTYTQERRKWILAQRHTTNSLKSHNKCGGKGLNFYIGP